MNKYNVATHQMLGIKVEILYAMARMNLDLDS
jgi:hypothetical protein